MTIVQIVVLLFRDKHPNQLQMSLDHTKSQLMKQKWREEKRENIDFTPTEDDVSQFLEQFSTNFLLNGRRYFCRNP